MFQDLHPSLRNVMYGVLISFIALVAATFYTIRLTFQNFEPVIDKNYYEIGLNYEQVIKDQKELIRLGYDLESKVGDGSAILPQGPLPISVSIKKDGKITDANSVLIILERSATTKQAKTFTLSKDNLGKFIGEINPSGSGTWNTRIIADITGKKFEKQGVIAIR